MKKSIFHVVLVCMSLAYIGIVWGAEFLSPPPKNVPALLVSDIESGSEKCQDRHYANELSTNEMKACFPTKDYGWGRAVKEAFKEIDAITAGNCHGLYCNTQTRSTFGVVQAYHEAFSGGRGHITLLALQRKPKALSRLYMWVIPHVKAKFQALSDGEQKEYMEILQHARDYAHTFNYKKEKAYYVKTCGRKELCNKFKREGPDGMSTYRYVETFIFRRVRDGMRIKYIRSWIDRLISDLK